MEALLHDIVQLLLRIGPWIVFFVTAAETAVFLGLLLPSGAAVLVAAFLADLGYFDVGDVLLATLLGGFTGDQIGYVLGRFGGRRVAAHDGFIGRMWRRHEARAILLFRQRSLLSVTLARFIAFVRTLMPWFAGMSGMSYPRFLAYDVLGVLGWGVGSVTAGYMAGRSWHVMAGALGTFSTVVVLLLVAGAAWLALRSRRIMKGVVRVAVTGNIASGKSTVTDVWREHGAAVIDADELARAAVAPGTSGLREVVRAFGRDVLEENGALDRGAVRRIVFADDRKRQLLENIVHPEVERLRRIAEQEAVKGGARIVVHSIPLLFEKAMDEMFPVVVLVDAPEALRRERIVAGRGLTPAEADAMIAAQMPAAGKRERATHVIENDGSLDELVRRAKAVWSEIEDVA
ncbi:MAG TPA: dephospho-CoA kinase [Longimicrobiales bacterium]|nr:dephospho-CoA kinase [Longimicrobiales bacterium]